MSNTNMQLIVERRTEKLEKVIDGLLRKIADLKPIFAEFAKKYRSEWVMKNFSTRGEIFGKRWAAYSPNYLKWKQEHAPGAQMMVLSGELQSAAMGESPNSVTIITKNSLEMGIKNLPYSRVHQDGSMANVSLKGKNISGTPQRPYFYGYNGRIPLGALRMFKNLLTKSIEAGTNV